VERVSNPLVNMPEGEPMDVVAGDTWTWKRSDLASDYPVASYQLSYALKRETSSDAPTVIVAAESGSEYQVTIAAATTAGLTPGQWRWDAYMTRSSDSARVRVGWGRLTVNANAATATADPRSHAQKLLAQIEALLEGRALQDVNSYSIKDRSLTKMTAEELTTWRDYYRREVNAEKIAERRRLGQSTGRTTVVRFSS
jgi:hypothetical protein